jgi:large subunit ribosomal protein L7/L12
MKSSKIIRHIFALNEADFTNLVINLAKEGLVSCGSLKSNCTKNGKLKTFSVNLLEIGSNKLNLVRFLKLDLGLGLIEAKELTESAPCVIKTFTERNKAEFYKSQILAIGASCEIV